MLFLNILKRDYRELLQPLDFNAEAVVGLNSRDDWQLYHADLDHLMAGEGRV